MARLTDILTRLKKDRYTHYSGFDRIAAYVRDGDDAALRSIPKPGKHEYWTSDLIRALRDPPDWSEEDRRLVHVFLVLKADDVLWDWLDNCLAREREDQDFFEVVARECAGLATPYIAARALQRIDRLVRNGRPTSFGRHLLRMDDEVLDRTVSAATFTNSAPAFVALLLEHAPDRLDRVLPGVFSNLRWASDSADVLAVLLQKAGDKYEAYVAEHVAVEDDRWSQFLQMRELFAHAPDRYRQTALDVTRRAMGGSPNMVNKFMVAEFMAERLGEEVVPDLVAYARQATREFDVGNMAQMAGAHMGAAAVPVFEALIANQYPDVQSVGLEALIKLDDATHAEMIESHLRQRLAESSAEDVLKSLALAQKWRPECLSDVLWELLEHKSKPVRSAASRALAKGGEAAVEKATTLLQHKRGDIRLAAAQLLAGAGTEKALAALEARLDDESNEDVRDQMLLGLEDAWSRQGREITKADISARTKRTAKKLETAVADWIKEGNLPSLYWRDGKRLSERQIRYLFFRQSRAKEMRPDPEAAAVYRLLDRARSGPFAAAVLDAFLRSKQAASDRWAMTVAAMLGDDAVVPVLAAQIRIWVDAKRGKLAEYAVQALALLGTDAALLAVDSMAIRYRTKMKNVGRAAAESFALAAERQGITPDELGDRVVPWLCFKLGESTIIDAGASQYEVRLGTDFKLRYIDLKKNKTVKSLPKSASADVKSEMKEVAANLREVIKAQKLRLDNLLVRQRRWEVSRWRELFLDHPILLPFATRLVWGVYDGHGKLTGLFRALEDRTLTTNTDDAYELPSSARVGMVHPLEVDEDTRKAWLEHLSDYEVEPPFPQLEREVVAITEGQQNLKSYQELHGRSLNGMTFKGRAERLGWNRGSVVDAGGVSSYQKSFPAAGVDVLILIEGMFMGMDMYDEVTLGTVFFVRGGSVKYGSYEYDEPCGESDPRVLRFADVPPIVFSEVMGDVRRISGIKANQ